LFCIDFLGERFGWVLLYIKPYLGTKTATLFIKIRGDRVMIKPNYFSVCVLSGVASLSISQTVHAYDFTAGDVEASIYGYAQMNAVYDFDEAISSDFGTQAGDFSKLGQGGSEGHFDADALQSRIGFSATHKNGVKVVIEGDFRPGTFRIRHAYGSYGNWTIGRAWSNYTSWTGWVPTLDFDTSAGSPGIQDRAEQVRYTQGGFSVALEKDYFPNVDNWSAATKSSLPTATARYETALSEDVNVVVAGLVRQVAFDDGVTDETAVGYGGFAGASVQLGDVKVQGAVHYHDGANAYLYRSGENFIGIDAYLFNGDLETVPGYAATLGFSTKIGAGDFNAVWGMTKMDLDDYNDDVGVPAGAHETNTTAFVNYLWYPTDNVMMGVELGYFDAEFYHGDSADATRIMYSARFSF